MKDLQINIPLPIILCKFLIVLRYADSGVALLLGWGRGVGGLTNHEVL